MFTMKIIVREGIQKGTPANIRFWHKADTHSHANALPLPSQRPNRLPRNYGFLL